jgi:hypothetical protein
LSSSTGKTDKDVLRVREVREERSWVDVSGFNMALTLLAIDFTRCGVAGFGDGNKVIARGGVPGVQKCY